MCSVMVSPSFDLVIVTMSFKIFWAVSWIPSGVEGWQLLGTLVGRVGGGGGGGV